jgi:hypothetical protein
MEEVPFSNWLQQPGRNTNDARNSRKSAEVRAAISVGKKQGGELKASENIFQMRLERNTRQIGGLARV